MLETYPDPAALDRERYQASGGERDERIDHPNRESEARIDDVEDQLGRRGRAERCTAHRPRRARGGDDVAEVAAGGGAAR